MVYILLKTRIPSVRGTSIISDIRFYPTCLTKKSQKMDQIGSKPTTPRLLSTIKEKDLSFSTDGN